MVELTSKMQERSELRGRRVVRRPGPPAGLRVVPRDDKIRKYIKHPNGVSFREHGSVEWPNDRFTHRRLRDGDVTLEQKPEEKPAEQEQPKIEESKPEEVRPEEPTRRAPLAPRR